jgi:hypothetical protein
MTPMGYSTDQFALATFSDELVVHSSAALLLRPNSTLDSQSRTMPSIKRLNTIFQ